MVDPKFFLVLVINFSKHFNFEIIFTLCHEFLANIFSLFFEINISLKIGYISLELYET